MFAAVVKAQAKALREQQKKISSRTINKRSQYFAAVVLLDSARSLDNWLYCGAFCGFAPM
jgi:hypothetical protein